MLVLSCFFMLSSSFGLSLSYCGVWFIVNLLRRDVVRRLVVTRYLCEGDSDKQNGFDQYQIMIIGMLKN